MRRIIWLMTRSISCAAKVSAKMIQNAYMYIPRLAALLCLFSRIECCLAATFVTASQQARNVVTHMNLHGRWRIQPSVNCSMILLCLGHRVALSIWCENPSVWLPSDVLSQAIQMAVPPRCPQTPCDGRGSSIMTVKLVAFVVIFLRSLTLRGSVDT